MSTGIPRDLSVSGQQMTEAMAVLIPLRPMKGMAAAIVSHSSAAMASSWLTFRAAELAALNAEARRGSSVSRLRSCARTLIVSA